MWMPTDLETKHTSWNMRSFGQGVWAESELLADGVKISNAVDLVNWSDGLIQLTVCDHCGSVQCSSGNYACFRHARTYILLMPAFDEMAFGDWELTEYAAPGFMEERGAVLFAVHAAAIFTR